MEIEIRRATAEDSEAIALLSQQLGYPATASETASRIKLLLQSATDCLLVATRVGEVVAWIHGFIGIRIESEPFAEIGGLVVDEKYRGAGIATQLINRVKGWCQEQTIDKLRVRCHVRRAETHRFYLNRGFIRTKEQKVFDLILNGGKPL